MARPGEGAIPKAQDLGKISFQSSPIQIQHLGPFKSFTQDETLPVQVQRFISDYVGMNIEIFQAWLFVLPIFGVFESIYMRAATQFGHIIAPENNKGFPNIGIVPWDKYQRTYREFRDAFRTAHQLEFEQTLIVLDNHGYGRRAARRFYNYFTGKELTEGLGVDSNDDYFQFPTKKLGSCANILGCTFNLNPVEDFLKGNRELLIHKEHSRPNSNFEGDPDQTMCAPHNIYKGHNKIHDVFGLYYCATGKNLR